MRRGTLLPSPAATFWSVNRFKRACARDDEGGQKSPFLGVDGEKKSGARVPVDTRITMYCNFLKLNKTNFFCDFF